MQLELDLGLTLFETGWLSILPPLVAITLALWTKEVYSSLLAGILTGAVIYGFASHCGPLTAVSLIFDVMSFKIAENGGMIIFLALLWGVVVVVTKSGGAAAYGEWAQKRLRTARSSRLATALLGLLIFIDDGFNCLTVGTVMRPITDRNRVSREKLAYLIDATAAPVCIIAPISSWAVAVASEAGGFTAFLRTIPYNLYALLTLVMVFFLSATGWDFGPMKKAEAKALGLADDRARTQEPGPAPDAASPERNASAPKGRVIDLVLPIAVLIVCAILGMAWVGGFFEGVPFTEAIGVNAVKGLSLGAFAGLLTALLLYLPRRLMTFREFMESIVQGVKNIVPPMLILVLSWSLGGVCRQLLGTGIFVAHFVETVRLSLRLLPAIVFVIAAFLSFSTGTAWGSFGILIPIVTAVFEQNGHETLLIPTLAATLAGSVYGDHCSPLSDTTILASTGADVPHIAHVETQMPYATLVAGVCAAGYVLTGLLASPWIPLAASTALLLAILFVLHRRQGRANSAL